MGIIKVAKIANFMIWRAMAMLSGIRCRGCLIYGALTAAFLEFGFEVGEGEVAVGEEDEEVVEEIGRFFDEALVALAFGGEDNLDGFFTDFFDDFVFTGREEVAGVGVGGGLVFALFDGVKEFRQDGGHRLPVIILVFGRSRPGGR
jgi:hypothetical protein